MNTVKALKIKGTDNVLIKEGWLNTSFYYYINNVAIDDVLYRQDITLSINSDFQIESKKGQLKDYRRNNEVMTIQEFKDKPQYFDDDSSDEFILRAIANKKELKGFKRYLEKEKQKVELNIVGCISDTQSEFIACSITGQYEKHNVLYTVDGRSIAMNEYLLLTEEHAAHARFGKEDRSYLRFTQINGNYAFDDSKPFGDYQYRASFIDLYRAQEEENKIRESVRSAVLKNVFPEKLTIEKASRILAQVNIALDLKSKNDKDHVLRHIIDDLNKYISHQS